MPATHRENKNKTRKYYAVSALITAKQSDVAGFPIRAFFGRRACNTQTIFTTACVFCTTHQAGRVEVPDAASAFFADFSLHASDTDTHMLIAKFPGKQLQTFETCLPTNTCSMVLCTIRCSMHWTCKHHTKGAQNSGHSDDGALRVGATQLDIVSNDCCFWCRVIVFQGLQVWIQTVLGEVEFLIKSSVRTTACTVVTAAGATQHQLHWTSGQACILRQGEARCLSSAPCCSEAA